MLFYYYPNAGINYFLAFFGLNFKVNFGGFLKKLAFKIFISIPLECISRGLTIIFVTYNNF